MPPLIAGPTIVEVVGNMPKRIEEYAGKVNSGHGAEYIAVCRPAFSPATVHRDG
jgi:hypothetical protein